MAIIKKINYACPSCKESFTTFVDEKEAAVVDEMTCFFCNESKIERSELTGQEVIPYRTIIGEDVSKVQVSVPPIVSGHNMRSKVGGFNEVLSKIKEGHPRHRIDGELS